MAQKINKLSLVKYLLQFLLLLTLHYYIIKCENNFDEFLNPRDLQSQTCTIKNMYPIFYGGTSNNFVRYIDASSDGKYILMCGESYSQVNFVNRSIEAFAIMVNAEDGTYIWGKYYQDNITNATNYVGLLNVCKFTNKNPQRVMVAGQINFYRPFFGFINMDGESEIFFQIFSNLVGDNVGYTGITLDIDQNNNIFGSVYFMYKALQVFKLNTKYRIFDWQYQVATDEHASMSTGSPKSCMDQSSNFIYFGGAVLFNDTNEWGLVDDNGVLLDQVYQNSSILQLERSTGSLNWLKKNPKLDTIGQMECLNYNGGVVGCGNYAATAHVFLMQTNGNVVYTYMYTGDNPESCMGIIATNTQFYVLLESGALSYTNSGYRDAIIVQHDINGRMRRGKFMTLRSSMTLSKNLAMFSDGSFAFAGNSRRALDMNFQYQAMFLMRANPFLNGQDDYSCLTMEQIPDPTAYGYNDQIGNFTDVKDIKNPNFKLYSLQVLNITVFTNITAWDLKSIYKAYQMCFAVSFYNPYEQVVGNQTIILSESEVNINMNNTVDPDIMEAFAQKPLTYYLGEVGQYKDLNDRSYNRLKRSPMNISLNNGSAIPDFLSIVNDRINVYTNDTKNIGNFMIMFSGCINNARAIYYQEIRVRNNSAPFVKIAQFTYYFDIRNTYQVQIPPIQDKERNSAYIVSLYLSDYSNLPYFIKLDTKNLIINVKPLSPIDVGNYTLVLKIAEADAPSYYSLYYYKFNVQDPNATLVPTGEKELTGKISDYSTDGTVKISFNQEIAIPPQSYDQIKEAEFVKLHITGPREPYEYTWYIKSITNKYMIIQITFSEPSSIGLFSVSFNLQNLSKYLSKQNYDYYNIQFQDKETAEIQINRYLFETISRNGNYLQNLNYEADIALIIDKEDDLLQSLQGVATAMSVMLGAVIGSSLIGQAVMSQAMSNLWALLNGLQILNYFVFFHVNLLPHIYIFFDMLLISHFDVIPFKDFIYEKIEDSDSTFIAINYNFSLYGFDSQLFVMNMADTYLLIMILIGFYVLYKAISMVFIKTQTTRFKRAKDYVNEQLNEYKYSAFIRTTLEIYLDLSLFSYMNVVRYYMEDDLNITSGAFAIFFFIISIIIPIVTAAFIYKKQTQLQHDKEFIEKYGSLVKGIRSDQPLSRNFYLVFLIRRFYYILLFAMPPEMVYYQLGLNLVHCIAVRKVNIYSYLIIQLSYNCIIRPCNEFKLNFQEILNEICIFLCACLWFCMTDAVEDITTKNNMGWAIIIIVLTTLIINLVIVIIEMVKEVRKKIQDCKNRRKKSKYLDESSHEESKQDADVKNNKNSHTDGDRNQNTLAQLSKNQDQQYKSDRSKSKKPKNQDDIVVQDLNQEETKLDDTFMGMVNNKNNNFESTLTAKTNKVPKKTKKHHMQQLPSQDITGITPGEEEFENDQSNFDEEFYQAKKNRNVIMQGINQHFGQNFDPLRFMLKQQNQQLSQQPQKQQQSRNLQDLQKQYNTEAHQPNQSLEKTLDINEQKSFQSQEPKINKVEQQKLKTKKRKALQKFQQQQKEQKQASNDPQDQSDFVSKPFNQQKTQKLDKHDDFDELD